jgi:membrane protease YdiL (CAAX protease family)
MTLVLGLGLIFCGLYVASGNLMVPIALHAIIDLRWALPPAAK